MIKNVSFVVLFLCNLALITHDVIKSEFLRVSRIGRHSRKIDFSFISLEHTFR